MGNSRGNSKELWATDLESKWPLPPSPGARSSPLPTSLKSWTLYRRNVIGKAAEQGEGMVCLGTLSGLEELEGKVRRWGELGEAEQ